MKTRQSPPQPDPKSPSVNRRDFIGKTLAGATAATVLSGCGPGADSAGGPAVQTRPRVNWRLTSSFPRGLDAIFGAAEVMAQTLDTLTDGRFRVRVHPSGEIVPGLQVMDAVQQGTVQAAHTASYYFVGKSPALAFDVGVPFGFTSRQQTAWLEEGGGLELMQGVYADFNIIQFPGGNTGAQMGGWFKREIHTASDLRGLKMRIPGLGGAVMDRLGVTVQVLAGGDIYPALERGAIDATEWVGPYDDEKLGFHKAAPYYYYPGWWEPGPSLSFQVNKDAWDQLPSAHQDAFRAASIVASQFMQTKYDAENPAALRRLVAEGVQLRAFSRDIMAAAQRIAFEIMEENAAEDPAYRRVYTAWREFREASFQWFGTAEQAYADFAFGSG
ncbi:MAG: TRAP transporter substrate-binding protein [Gemmatimonadales bacterium]|nr:TRAP transporter substrate-binding protein [Gemmatimonadales bacterium]